MSWLRYKDLDFLEGIFKMWMSEGREAMSIKGAFTARIRQMLQSRVENLTGLVDLGLFHLQEVSSFIHKFVNLFVVIWDQFNRFMT